MLFSKPVIPLATMLLAAHLAVAKAGDLSASLVAREPGKISGEPAPAFVSAPPIPKDLYEGWTKSGSASAHSTIKQPTTTAAAAAASRRDVSPTSESSPVPLSCTPSPTPEEIVVGEQDSGENEDEDEKDEMCDTNEHGKKIKRAPVGSKTHPPSDQSWYKRTPRGRGSAKAAANAGQAVPPYAVPRNGTGGAVSSTGHVPVASGAPVKRAAPDGSWWKRTPRGRGSAKAAANAGQAAPPYPLARNATGAAGQRQGHATGAAPAASGVPVKRAGGAGSGYGGYSGGGATGNRTGEHASKAGNPTATQPAWTSGAAPPHATGSGKPNNGAGSGKGKSRRSITADDIAA